ncbi:MAG: hypothetical protein QOE92_2352, partial [Chloroflexota bacterium]|nr:hypothetical protein [Chloroflexota bacterium]
MTARAGADHQARLDGHAAELRDPAEVVAGLQLGAPVAVDGDPRRVGHP